MSDLRDVLLDVLPDESLVDEFLAKVEGTNGQARTRIARAVESTTEEVETLAETVEEEEVTVDVIEAEDVDVDVEEEVVEVESTEVEYELGEEFVSDVTSGVLGNETFRAFVEGLVSTLRTEFEDKYRSLDERLQDKVEAVEDTPSRNKRAVVKPFYRARNINRNIDIEVSGESKQHTASQEIADETIRNIFGGK